MKVVVDGYVWLNFDDLTEVQVEWFKKQLTMVQSISPEYAGRKKDGGPPPTIRCYQEDLVNRKLGIAREFFYANAKQDHQIEYNVTKGHAWPDKVAHEGQPWAQFVSDDPGELTLVDAMPQGGNPVTRIQLSGEQTLALEATMSHLNSRPASGGIIQAPTGWGKTVFALALIQKMRLKTAVLVHRAFLANQWKKRIANFLPDAKVGTIQGTEWDIEGAHIVLVMVETLASWVKGNKLPEGIGDIFGMVVTDEVHRIGAPSWSQTIPIFHAAKRVGVSATPRRSDGLDKVFWHSIGPKIYTGQELRLQPKIRRVWSTFKVNSNPRFNPDFLSKESVVKIMRKNAIYNYQVVEQIMLAVTAGRKVLVFSDVVDHLKAMYDELRNNWNGKPITQAFFIGGMTQDELDESGDADVIFATYKMASEGMDIPAIDTVVLATPLRNPEQTVGRCLRPFPGKKDPVVVDMRCDDVKICRDYAESRDRHYARLYESEKK